MGENEATWLLRRPSISMSKDQERDFAERRDRMVWTLSELEGQFAD